MATLFSIYRNNAISIYWRGVQTISDTEHNTTSNLQRPTNTWPRNNKKFSKSQNHIYSYSICIKKTWNAMWMDTCSLSASMYTHILQNSKNTFQVFIIMLQSSTGWVFTLPQNTDVDLWKISQDVRTNLILCQTFTLPLSLFERKKHLFHAIPFNLLNVERLLLHPGLLLFSIPEAKQSKDFPELTELCTH